MEEGDTDGVHIDNLPNEVLEYVLSLLSPYRDFRAAQLVCKRWNKVMSVVIEAAQSSFYKAVCEGHMAWLSQPSSYGALITERHSHSAAYLDKAIYVFGGCTPTSTTFNDLWRLDLSTRQWVRPLALGTYPSPKACASLVAYQDNLVLFGGWSHPTPYPLHQAARFFKELHVYSTKTNQWYYVVPTSNGTPTSSPPGTAGHAATVVGDKMIVFGGSQALGLSCNSVWVLDLVAMSWKHQETSNIKPNTRYGHSQLALDDEHLLIIGGCGGPNNLFNDIWLLSMAGATWEWREMQILDKENSPSQLWCHAACRVRDRVVVLSKTQGRSPLLRRGASRPPPPRPRMNSRAKSPHCQPGDMSGSSSQDSSSDAEEGVVTRRPLRPSYASVRNSGPSRHPPPPPPSPPARGSQSHSEESTAPVRHGMPSVRPNAMKNRQKQLETLKRYEELFKGLGQGAGRLGADAEQSEAQSVQNPMYMHILNVSRAISHGEVKWQPLTENFLGVPPEETIFYSLVHGRGELVMFGGIQADLSSMQRGLHSQQQTVSNRVIYLQAQKTLY